MEPTLLKLPFGIPGSDANDRRRPRVASRFGDHVGLDGIQIGKFMRQPLTRIAVEPRRWTPRTLFVRYDTLLQELHGLLRRTGNLIDTRSANSDLFLHYVAVWRAVHAAIFIQDSEIELGVVSGQIARSDFTLCDIAVAPSRGFDLHVQCPSAE
jgi:hypothetical protein